MALRDVKNRLSEVVDQVEREHDRIIYRIDHRLIIFAIEHRTDVYR